MLKKVALVLGIIAVLIVGALVAIPMFYSVDQFRPQIQAAIEKSIRGKVELGKISFSLFPSINVKVDGVTVKAPAPFDKEPLAVIKAVEVKMPLSSLLSAPTGTIVISQVNVKMVSHGLKSNLSETLPPPKTEAELKAIQVEAKKSAALDETLKGLPAFIGSKVAAARFAFELNNTEVDISKDGAPKGEKTKITGLSAELSGIGISTDMKLHAQGEVDVAAAGAVVKGPFSADGTLKYQPVGHSHEITLKVDNDLKGIDISFKPLFHKASGVPFGTGVEGVLLVGIEKTDVKLNQLKFRFANVETVGSVRATTDAIDPTKGEFNAAFKVENFDLAAWGTLVPMVRDFALGGKVGVDIKASGPIKNPGVDVAINLSGVTGATPTLKKPITDLGGKIRISGTALDPKVTIDPFGLKLGSGDIGFKMQTSGLDPISVKINVTSSNLDADELLGLPTPGTATTAASTGSSGAAPKGEAKSETKGSVPPAQALDAAIVAMAPMIEDQLENPMLGKASAQISADFKKIKVTGAVFSNAKFNMNYSGRKLTIAKTGIGAFGGQMDLDVALDLNNPKSMGYSFNAGMKGVNVEEMTSIYAPAFKKDISGLMTGSFSLSGHGFRKEQLEKSLAGAVKGEFVNGHLSLPVQKLAIDTVGGLVKEYTKNGALSKLGTKFDPSKTPEGPRKGGEFKTAKMDCEIKGRALNLALLDVAFKADNNQPSLFKGKGTVTFDRAVSFIGVSYLSDERGNYNWLKGSSGMIEVPLKISGTIDEPKTEFAYTLGEVSKTAGKYFAKQMGQAAATKAIDALAAQAAKAPAPVQKAIEKAGGVEKAKEGLKKLFGH